MSWVRNLLYPFFGGLVSIIVLLVIGSCAVIKPPSGGPKDTTPPLLIYEEPPSGTLQYNGEQIRLEFSEYMDEASIEKGIHIFPNIEGEISINTSGTNFEFATSNVMWRATLEILEFLPLANVDYGGGIISTDWYNEGTSLDESIKITVRFLTNEIRSDGIRIIVHKKLCNIEQNCKITKISSAIEQELQVAILKKAILFEKEYSKSKQKFKRGELK